MMHELSRLSAERLQTSMRPLPLRKNSFAGASYINQQGLFQYSRMIGTFHNEHCIEQNLHQVRGHVKKYSESSGRRSRTFTFAQSLSSVR